MRELRGKTAFITGAASGIGFGMATEYEPPAERRQLSVAMIRNGLDPLQVGVAVRRARAALRSVEPSRRDS